MNHDNAHCLDYRSSCPEKCFRAQLERDLLAHPGIVRWLTYSHLRETEECLAASKEGKDERND